jgi:hypothetical protein
VRIVRLGHETASSDSERCDPGSLATPSSLSGLGRRFFSGFYPILYWGL